MYMFIHVYVYVSIVYRLSSPMLEEIKNLSIYGERCNAVFWRMKLSGITN